MSLSKYEAAAFCDYHLSESSSPADYLILDLDEGAFAWCICSGKNEIRQKASWSEQKQNFWEDLLQEIRKKVPEASSGRLEEEVQNQLPGAARVLHSYFLSGGAADGKAFEFSGHSISCSELEKLADTVKKNLDHLLSLALSQVSDEQMEEVRIILLGKAQELYLIPYWIRELISYDPLLPDDRLRNDGLQVPYTELAERGNAFYESASGRKHTYRLIAFNPKTNASETLYEVSKEQKTADQADFTGSGPMLIWEGEPILVQADDSLLKIALPYAIGPAGSDLIETAITQKNHEDLLVIRRSRFPSRIYEVKLA